MQKRVTQNKLVKLISKNAEKKMSLVAASFRYLLSAFLLGEPLRVQIKLVNDFYSITYVENNMVHES